MICWNATKYKQDLQALTNISDSLLRLRKVHVPHFSDMKDTFFHIGQKHVSFQVSLLFVSHEEEDGWGRFRHNFNGFRSARNNMNIQRGVQEKEKFGVFSIWRENKERKFLTDLVEEVPFAQIFWGNLPLILQTSWVFWPISIALGCVKNWDSYHFLNNNLQCFLSNIYPIKVLTNKQLRTYQYVAKAWIAQLCMTTDFL